MQRLIVILPTEVKQIELQGFAVSEWEAIRLYFYIQTFSAICVFG